jgi:hypothetical protein
MKKSFFIAIAILSLITVAQAKQKKTSKKTAITYVSMSRTACYGRCPDYKIELFSNGLVRYSGYMFVADSGVYEKYVGRAKVQKLFNEFVLNRADTCKDKYELRVMDLPGLYYTIKYGNKTKKIDNANMGPYFLRDMATDIDNAIKVDKTWKKVANEAKR